VANNTLTHQSDGALDSIARRCFEAAVDGLRADLVWLRAARAHAAWRGGERIEAEDIDAVEHFALLHHSHRSTQEKETL
ncbi:hypothetical protein ACLBQD_31525, partial [Klebsiella pneumoniae]